jgi:hypothetical protein
MLWAVTGHGCDAVLAAYILVVNAFKGDNRTNRCTCAATTARLCAAPFKGYYRACCQGVGERFGTPFYFKANG